LADHDVLLAEVGAALAILGLLLVFLPLFLASVEQAGGGAETASERQWRVFRSWLIPVTMAGAAVDATFGLLTVWGTCNLAKPTALLLIALAFSVVLLAAIAVWTTQ
jgi:hypothetical protein